VGNDESDLRVLHVLPADLARGAQVYARALRDELESTGQEHRLLTLFGTDASVLAADYRLGLHGGMWRRFGFDPRCVVELRRALRRFRPDVVVAHGGEALKYAALARIDRPPLLYYSIGVVMDSARSFPRRTLYRFLAGRADLVIGVSQEVVDESRTLLGVRTDRLALLPNARDPSVYKPRQASGGPPSDPPVVAFVGHLTATKRPQTFISVIAALRARGIAVRALMVGGGPLLDDLTGPAGAAGVEVLGTRQDVAEILPGCDLLVFPSLPEGEGMPGVLIEAGLAGLAVVATDVPGASTVIADGVTGRIVPVHDTVALVDAVAELIAEPARLAEMGAAARQRCVAQFSIAESAASWRELFGRVAPGH
jgi:glycosyltransferase involved in cell wall biosynthesis